MKNGLLEHVNVTVRDAKKTAAMFADFFGWKIRWQGASMNDGYSVHVGSDASYLALYTPKELKDGADSKSDIRANLNHIGIEVDDLDRVRDKASSAGYELYNFGDYEPGRRFYFTDENGIEFEIVSYA